MKKILVVHFEAIGDVLRATPAIRGLKERYPDSHLSFLTFPLCAEILENNPFIDRIIVYDKRKYRRELLKRKTPLKDIFFEVKSFIKSLQQEKFDLVINLHSTPHSAILTSLIKAKEVRGHFFDEFGQSSFGDKWTYYLMLVTSSTGIARSVSHEELYALTADVDMSFKELFLNLTLEEKERAASLLKEHKVTREDKLIAIHPGAGWPEKRWSEESFAKLAGSLLGQGAKVVFLGSKWERGGVERILKQMENEAINLTGQTSLREMAAIIDQASLLISNDTCATHFAGALRTPSIILCGPTLIWSQSWDGNILIQSDVRCAPCGHGEGCKNHICMEAIPPEAVLKAIELREILVKNGPGRNLLKDPSFKNVRLYYSGTEKKEGLFYYAPLRKEKDGIDKILKKIMDLAFLDVWSRIDPPAFSQNRYGRNLIAPKEIAHRINSEFEFKEGKLLKKIGQAEEKFVEFVQLTTSAKVISDQAARIVERKLFMPEIFSSLLNQLNEIDGKLVDSYKVSCYLVNLMIQDKRPPSFGTPEDILRFCKRSALLYDSLREISLEMAKTLGEIKLEIKKL